MKYSKFFIGEVCEVIADQNLIERAFSIDGNLNDCRKNIKELKKASKIRPYLICIHPLSKKYKNSPVVFLGEFTCWLNDLRGKNIRIYVYDIRVWMGYINETFGPTQKMVEKDGEILKVSVVNSQGEKIIFDSVKNFSSKDIERLEDENPNLLKLDPLIKQSVLKCISRPTIIGKSLSFYSVSQSKFCNVDILGLENYLLNICKLTEKMLVNHVNFRNLTLEGYMGLSRETINSGFIGTESISRLAAEYLRKSVVGDLMQLCGSIVEPVLYKTLGDYGNWGGIIWQANKKLKGDIYKVDLNSAYAEPLLHSVPIPQLVPSDKATNAIHFCVCKISNFRWKNEGFKQFKELNNFLRMQEKDNTVTIWGDLLDFLKEIADFEIEILDSFYFRKIGTQLNKLLEGINTLRTNLNFRESSKSVLQRMYGKLCQKKWESEIYYRSRIAGCYITQFVQLKLMRTIRAFIDQCPDIKFGHINTDGFVFQTKSQKWRELITIDSKIGNWKVESDNALEYVAKNPSFYLIENNNKNIKLALSGFSSISLMKKLIREGFLGLVKKYVENPRCSRFLVLQKNLFGEYVYVPIFMTFDDKSCKVVWDFINDSLVKWQR